MQVNQGTWQAKLLAERGVTAQKTMPMDMLTSNLSDNNSESSSLDDSQQFDIKLGSDFWRNKISAENGSTIQENATVRDRSINPAEIKTSKPENNKSFVEAEQERSGQDQERMKTLDNTKESFLANYLARHAKKQVALARAR